jgi:hypothetical protein
MPVTVVPTSLATVAMDTFVTEVQRHEELGRGQGQKNDGAATWMCARGVAEAGIVPHAFGGGRDAGI